MDFRQKIIKKFPEFLERQIKLAPSYMSSKELGWKSEEQNNYKKFFISSKSTISSEKLMEEYRNYLYDKDSKDLCFQFDIKIKRVILSLLLKEKPDDDIRKKIVDSCLDDKTQLDSQWFIFEKCKEPQYKEYGKKIILNLLENYKYKVNSSFSLVGSLGDLSNFKFQKEEYPLLDNFFNANSHLSKSYPKEFMHFLKSSIIAQDWSYFQKHAPHLLSVQKELPLFEQKNNHVQIIKINLDNIRNNYPIMSHKEDIKKMLKNILNIINHNPAMLEIEKLYFSGEFYLLGSQDLSSHDLTIVSKDEKPANINHIKKFLSSFMDGYIKEIQLDSKIDDEKMKRLMVHINHSFLEASITHKADEKARKNKL